MSNKANKHIPYCKHEGIEYIMGSGRPRHGSFGFLVTCGGTGTDSVDFSDLGYSEMADVSYAVIVHSEAGTVTVDESSKTVGGFDLINGAGGEVANVMVAGKLASMDI